MKRKLAVPIAVEQGHSSHKETILRTRLLKLSDEETEEQEVLAKLVENKLRIDALAKEIDETWSELDPDDEEELDYIEATIQLGLLEITGELEATPYSDELFEQAVA